MLNDTLSHKGKHFFKTCVKSYSPSLARLPYSASDNGFTFNGSVLLVVLIPGPIIIIEGKGNFLKNRNDLDT